MASIDPIQNGHSGLNGNGAELSAAQKLMLKHDEAHKATIEEVPDEDDLKHGEQPTSSSVLEAADESASAPGWVPPMSAKAAGKQRAEEPSSKENKKPSLDTQSHDLFPALGGAPKPKPATNVAPIWSMKKPATPVPSSPNGKTNGTATNGNSTPTSGTATPTSVVPAARGGPQSMAIPGRQQERIQMAPNQMLPRNQLKKPLPDILKDINKKSKATVTMTSGQQGIIWFNAVGPQEACRQALKDVVAQVGSKVSNGDIF